MSEIPHIILIDDDDVFRNRLLQALVERGNSVAGFGSLKDVRSVLESKTFTHAVLDLKLAGESGLDIVSELSARNIRVVLLTGYGSVATALEAIRRGACNYLTKPASFSAIEQALFGPPLAPVRDDADLSSDVPSLDEVEWEHIQRVLRDCNGNITHASKKLGIHRQALQRKLREGRTG